MLAFALQIYYIAMKKRNRKKLNNQFRPCFLRRRPGRLGSAGNAGA
jgi:hypothetical protein